MCFVKGWAQWAAFENVFTGNLISLMFLSFVNSQTKDAVYFRNDFCHAIHEGIFTSVSGFRTEVETTGNV